MTRTIGGDGKISSKRFLVGTHEFGNVRAAEIRR